MKSVRTILFSVAALFILHHAHAQKAEWKELSDFHTIMSKTFHPAEDGNLQPVKDNAAELVAKAKAWQSSVAPAGYSKELVTKTLGELVSSCLDLQKAVKAKKTDETLTKLITAAHEKFHEIVEKCKKEEEK